jgi:hypothetical protein
MKRLLSQIFRKQRLAIFNFFALSILLLGSCSDLLSQELKKFRLEEGETAPWDVSIKNNCKVKPHRFRIENKYNYISFAEPTDSILVGVRLLKSIIATVNTAGLESKVYKGKVIVECLDCKKGCVQDRFLLPFEITVTKPFLKPIPTPTSTETSILPTETPKPIETPKLNETPTETPTPTPTEIPKLTEIPTPTETPAAPTETQTTPAPTISPTTPTPTTPTPTTPTPTLTQASNPTETSNMSPTTLLAAETAPSTPSRAETSTQFSSLIAKSIEALPLTSPPAKTPLADEIPTAETARTPLAEDSQNSTLPANVSVNYLNYLLMVLVLASALLLALLVAKKLFDKWKYGNNAAQNLGSLKKAIAAKEELAGKWLKRRKTQNLHAIGVGKIDGTNNYCIQLFVENANGEMPDNPPIDLLPEKYRKLPIVIYEMPRAEFLNFNGSEDYGNKAKEPHDTIIGGISGANTNLANEYGTIGYFCAPTILRPIRKFRKEVYLLSNSHVFANLSKPEKCTNDLIQQPSPGENKRHNFIASLENYVPILFDNDTEHPNYIDAAIAKMFQGKQYKLEIPVIGTINDYVPKDKIEIRQACQKFGRTTGYTQGKVFSIHFSIWIRYAVNGQESFFKEQFLILPTEENKDFQQGGDSGSLVADYENKAIGLLFAGANSNNKFDVINLPEIDIKSLSASISTEKIRSFGVANPISEVLKRLNVKLIVSK